MPRSQYSTLQCGIQAISKKFSIRRGIFKIGVCRNFFQKTNIFFVPKNEKSARNLLFLRFGCVWGFRGFFISAQSKNRPEKAVLFDGGTESRKNAHSIISDKQNGILLPSRFTAFGLSAIRQTISRKPGLMPCRWLAPCKRLSLRLYRSALTAVSLVPYSAANRHICFCFRR